MLLDAYALETNKRVIVPNLHKYHRVVTWKNLSLQSSFLGSEFIAWQLIKRGYIRDRLWNFLHIDFKSLKYNKYQSFGRILAWKSAVELLDYLEGKKGFARSRVHFNQEDMDSINTLFGTRKILGVHVRRGDYVTWRNGRYYYDLCQYNRLIKSALSCDQFDGVFISSNDIEARAFFKNQGYYTGTLNSVGEDLFGLSSCAAIIGPPSSFSMFASFYSETPLQWIFEGDQKTFLHLENHVYVKNFYCFSNNTALVENGDTAVTLKRVLKPNLSSFDWDF